MSHSIILLTRSSCKCGVLFKGYPSVINNKQVPCPSSLSIRLRGHLGTGSRKGKIQREASEGRCNTKTMQFWGRKNLILKKSQTSWLSLWLQTTLFAGCLVDSINVTDLRRVHMKRCMEIMFIWKTSFDFNAGTYKLEILLKSIIFCVH